MGYANYWQSERNLPEQAFNSASSDCKKVINSTGIPLGGISGESLPEFSDRLIAFNGAAGMACEDFRFGKRQIPRRGTVKASGYCKTERLAYDLCVKLALIVLKHHMGDLLVVLSDGEEGDWEEARQICQNDLRYGHNFKF